MATSDIAGQLKASRALLRVLSKDVNQIYTMGVKAVDEGDETKLPLFQAMFPRLETAFNDYVAKFNAAVTYAIISEREEWFPTADDTRLRSEVASLYYHATQHHQVIMRHEARQLVKPSAAGCDESNKSMLSRSRLPKIRLPRFSGQITDWPKFKQLYMSLIHNDIDMPNIEKFQYLLDSLSAEAASLISSLTIDETNYDEAWRALLAAYDNKRLLAATYIDKIVSFVPEKGQPLLSSLQSFLSVVSESVASFKAVKPPDEADFLFLCLALKRIDPDTRQRFETSSVNDEWPTYESLIKFIQNRVKVLKLAPSANPTPKPTPFNNKPYMKAKGHTLATTSNPTPEGTRKATKFTNNCPCNQGHLLYMCPKFKEYPLAERYNFLKHNNLCFNCFNQGHRSDVCSNPKRCQTCVGKHHTLLHNVPPNATPVELKPPPTAWKTPSTVGSTERSAIVASVMGPTNVVLGTAEVLVKDAQGRFQTIRMVLDCGSQFSLITAACARRLGLQWSPTSRSLQGAGQTPLPKVRGVLSCNLHPRVQPSSVLHTTPLVVTTITGNLPTVPIDPSQFCHILTTSLADPQFWHPRPIDFLLGNDIFLKILDNHTSPIVLGDCGTLPTIFGHVLMGQLPVGVDNSPFTCLSLAEAPVSDVVIQRFWEIEEVSLPVCEHPADKECEEHYVATHSRTPSGRYVVALPFKTSSTPLGDSKVQALNRFTHLERKLLRNPSLRTQYTEFLDEYFQLGHMSSSVQPSKYIIPHHAVFKSNDPKGKIRVVFDASMTTSSGSLNSKLHTGPKLQNDLATIILHFRKHAIGITADLVKMYRQVEVIPEHRAYQHILWRPSIDQPLCTYELNTIAYGMTSSPFLALRTLVQLTRDEGAAYPLAASVLQNDVYVDDLVTGTDSVEDAVRLKSQLEALLAKGQFPIHKWASNSSTFLRLSGLDGERAAIPLDPSTETYTKILGMAWNPQTDMFCYQTNPVPNPVTKRSILSTIARLFDPMGYLAPVLFYAKHLLQQLWRLPSLAWDDPPPMSIQQEWLEFVEQLPTLAQISIPRLATYCTPASIQLLGFCDASQKGYAAAFYLRSIAQSGEVKVHLLLAKTKLAPIKTLSIPRLELSAAHLLVKLFKALHSFRTSLSIQSVHLFTDSTIVLAWLRIPPQDLQTFVANRVSFIVSNTSLSQWHHVTSQQNPADIASRGILPAMLRQNSLWWHASTIFHSEFSGDPLQENWNVDYIPEIKRKVLTTLPDAEPEILSWVKRFSSYTRLVHSLAYVFRFVAKLRARGVTPKEETTFVPSRPLMLSEIDTAKVFIIKATQRQAFVSEFSWDENKPLSSRLQRLAAYKDQEGVLRVGGRITNSTLPYTVKHPILLPASCHFISVFIDQMHRAHFHLGSKALQAHIQRTYWVFRLRQTIQHKLLNCLRCRKMSAKCYSPFMGDLPGPRVRPSRPFSSVGVDYAGPFPIKQSSRRNAPTCKAYLAVFVCLATKAVHLELVSSLSTESFLATLDRFAARRGLPSDIYSDCGTNFVGANRKLLELYTWFKSPSVHSDIVHHTTAKSIKWHFNPPYSPHIGGLWEAVVKSTKGHLNKLLHNRPLQFEELATLFARIESILNSRPLCPVSSDPSDYDYLSPGHFLIGSPLDSVPEVNVAEQPVSRLSRWEFVQGTVQHFWKRWHTEYLQTLQTRVKWYKKEKSIETGDLVLLPDSASPPLSWRLARVVQCHPGEDEVVRVVSIKTPNGKVLRRSVHRLAPLFPSTSLDQE